MKTDPIKRARELRETLVRNGEALVVDYSNTLQGKDTSRVIELLPNINTGEHIFRSKVNVKEIDPIAMEGKADYFDVQAHSDAEVEVFIRNSEFDFPLWFKHNDGFNMKDALSYNPPFILQVAGCNFHDGSTEGGCSYCFVDNKSNDGAIGCGKTFIGAGDVVDSMIAARKKVEAQYLEHGTDLDMRVLRTSGGEPTIALDWILNIWREVERRGLGELVGQIDSNLSTGQLVEEFERTGVYESHILEKLADYPIKVLTALKGVSEGNLQENVQSTATLENQLHSLKRFIGAGFDIYPQMYNPNPAHLAAYLKKMDGAIESFSSRVHIGPLKMYGPTVKRLNSWADRLGVSRNEYRKAMAAQWDSNYKQGCEILDAHLRKHAKHDYKSVTRSDVPLKIRK